MKRGMRVWMGAEMIGDEMRRGLGPIVCRDVGEKFMEHVARSRMRKIRHMESIVIG